jgi:hypothetical protein
MEDGMDAPLDQEFELDCYRRDDFCNFEGSVASWC